MDHNARPTKQKRSSRRRETQNFAFRLDERPTFWPAVYFRPAIFRQGPKNTKLQPCVSSRRDAQFCKPASTNTKIGRLVGAIRRILRFVETSAPLSGWPLNWQLGQGSTESAQKGAAMGRQRPFRQRETHNFASRRRVRPTEVPSGRAPGAPGRPPVFHKRKAAIC